MSAPVTIHEILDSTVERVPDSPALGEIENQVVRWYTWRELGEQVDSLREKLQARGVSAGDRVVQSGVNSREWILLDLALHALGGVHVALHAVLDESTRNRLTDHADPKLVIPPGGTIEQAEAREPKLSSPNSLAAILYTSGTTGDPLGVMLSGDNFLANTRAVSEAAAGTGEETRLAILPFSHAYARTCDLYSWLLRGSRLVISRGRKHVQQDLQIAQPTVVVGVPYLFEKFSSSASGDNLRAAMGGNIRRCYTGGAPISASVVNKFAEAEIPLADGYGLTETSPVVAMANAGDVGPGTVGRPLPNLEVRLAGDGEVLVRGPSVMLGYWRNDEAAERAIVDGWLHTGDLGEWDPEGRLKIVGRAKEIIALSTGKKIPPGAVESRLVSSPLVEQAAVVGEGRPYPVVLLVPNPDLLKQEIRQRRLWVWSKRRAVTHPKIRQLYREMIAQQLADLPETMRPRDFAILTRGFSLEKGEMTAKLSLRRAVVQRNFAREIAGMYRS